MARTTVVGMYIQDTDAQGAGSTTDLKLRSILWTGFTDAAHTLQVKNGAGTIVVPAFACGAATSVIGPIQINFVPPKILKGIETDVIGSGVVTYLIE